MTLLSRSISAIIVTYNRAQLLPLAVKSLLEQTLAPDEIIVVDNGSTDETPRVLDQLASRHRIMRPVRLARNLGPGAGRNAGFALARGDLVAVLDDDDIALPERMACQAALMQAEKDTGLCFAPVRWVNGRGDVINSFPGIVLRGAFPEDSGEIFRLLYLESNKIPNTTLMFRRETFLRYQYPVSPWIGEDWLLCMQMAASGQKIRAVAHPLVHMRRDQATPSLMSDKARAFVAQRQVLQFMRRWLCKQGITSFDHLHRLAFANQFAREARIWGGLRGLLLCQRALLLAPNSAFVRETARSLAVKGLGKLRRLAR